MIESKPESFLEAEQYAASPSFLFDYDIFFFPCALSAQGRQLSVLVAEEASVILDGISELSGICLSKDDSNLLGVDDGGGLYKIDIDSSFAVTRPWKKSGEMEGLALGYRFKATKDLPF